MKSEDQVEAALAQLQGIIRRPSLDEPRSFGMMRQLPADTAGNNKRYLSLDINQVSAMEVVQDALAIDLRFEYLDAIDEVVWRFIISCVGDCASDHVAGFIGAHGRELLSKECYLPIEFLSVDVETVICGMRLLSPRDERVPATASGFSLERPVGCVAVVPVTGTNYKNMAERARVQVAHSLRVLRMALHEHRGINRKQIRFRLGTSFAFDEPVTYGWQQRFDIAYDLKLTEQVVEIVASQPVTTLPTQPTTDVDKKADVALRWLERAWLADEPIVALLYQFFALESLLGDKSEKLKAHGLAFRQAMLSSIVNGGFSHPNRTWLLYDEVRSGAVHGEDVPELSWDEVHSFGAVVRGTLSEYISFASERRFRRRGRLIREIDNHPDGPKLVAWLRENGGDIWSRYFDVQSAIGDR